FNDPPPSAESIMWYTGKASDFCRHNEEDYNQHCAVLGWYMEYDEFYRCHSEVDWWKLDIKNIGHFSSLVWTSVDRLGCAQHGDFFVCNYGNSKCNRRPEDDRICLWNQPEAPLLPNVNRATRCNASYDHCIQCRDDEKLDKGACGPLKVRLVSPPSCGEAVAKGLAAVNFAVHGGESSKSRGTVDMPSELDHERYSSPTPPLRTSTERMITTRATTVTTITSPAMTITTSITPTVGATTRLRVAVTTRAALSRRIQPSTVPPPRGATTERTKIRTRDSHDSKPRPKRRRNKDTPSR
ncbi:hypothetical protein FOZ62_009410, partial [Perkinsus olseni]